MKCYYSKLIGYTRGAVTIKGAVIYQSLRYATIVTVCILIAIEYLLELQEVH